MSKSKSDADETTPEKNSRKKLMIILIAAVLVLGGGGAGAYLTLFKGPAEPVEPEAGAVVVLDPVTINLADGHFLKIGLGLQAIKDVEEEPDGSKALDLTINYFSDRKMAELSSSQGRTKAKHELVEAVEEAYEGEIMDIYFREFVMQ
jgi:flagellar FliL protein